MFNENQIQEIEAHGLTVAQVEAQIEAFRRGFPSLKVVKAASPEDGITTLSEEECDNAVKYYDGIAEKLEAYVRNGGTLVVGFFSGVKDFNGL